MMFKFPVCGTCLYYGRIPVGWNDLVNWCFSPLVQHRRIHCLLFPCIVTWSMCVCKKTTYKLVVRRRKKPARLRWYMRLVRLHGFISASRECDSVPFASIYCLCSCKLCVFCLCMCRNIKKSDFKSIVYGAIYLCGLDFVFVWNIFASRSQEICKL